MSDRSGIARASAGRPHQLMEAVVTLVAHILNRIQRLRELAKLERARGGSLRLIRLKALQLRAQRRLAEVMVPEPRPQPVPVRVTSRRGR
jgi:hypothetical protein